MLKDFEMKTASKPSREKKRKRERRDVTENIGSNVEVVEDSQKNSSLVIGTGRNEEVPRSSKSKSKSLKRRGKRNSEDTIGDIDSNHEAVKDASSVQRKSCASKHKERIPEISHSSKRLSKTSRRSERLKSRGTAENSDSNHEAERNSFVVNCTEGNEEASRSSKSTSRPLKRQGKKQKKQDVTENVDSELEAERKSSGVTRRAE